VYIQQATIEPVHLHHDFYAMKMNEITDDIIERLNNPLNHQSSLATHMSILRRILDQLINYEQILIELSLDISTRMARLKTALTLAQEYSIADSLVREQINDLTWQHCQYRHEQERLIYLQDMRTKTYDRLRVQFVFDTDRQLFIELKQQG
jgi:hypothetical protein